MPAMSNSPVSGSLVTRKVGSSRRNCCSTRPSRSASVESTGLMARRITGSGMNMLSSAQYPGMAA